METGLQADRLCAGRAAQLLDLAAQRSDLLALLGAEQLATLAATSLGLPDVFAQRLALNAQVSSDMGDRPLALERQTDTARSTPVETSSFVTCQKAPSPADASTEQSLRQKPAWLNVAGYGLGSS